MEVKNVITRCSTKIAGFVAKLLFSLSFVPPLAVAEMCVFQARFSCQKKAKKIVIFLGGREGKVPEMPEYFSKKCIKNH